MALLLVRSDDGRWMEVGHGSVSLHSDEEGVFHLIVCDVRAEPLLQTPVTARDIFAVQSGDTLVWSDSVIGKELALRFDSVVELMRLYGEIASHASDPALWLVSVSNLPRLLQCAAESPHRFAAFLHDTPTFVSDLCALREGVRGLQVAHRNVAALVLALASPPYNTDGVVLRQLVAQENIDEVLFWIGEAVALGLLGSGQGAALQGGHGCRTISEALQSRAARHRMHRVPVALPAEVAAQVHYAMAIELLQDTVPLLLAVCDGEEASPLGRFAYSIRAQVVEQLTSSDDFVQQLLCASGTATPADLADRLGVLHDLVSVVQVVLVERFSVLVQHGLLTFLSMCFCRFAREGCYAALARTCELIERCVLGHPSCCLSELLRASTVAGPSESADDALLRAALRLLPRVADNGAAECVRDTLRAIACHLDVYREQPAEAHAVAGDTTPLTKARILQYWVTGSAVHLAVEEAPTPNLPSAATAAAPLERLMIDSAAGIAEAMGERREEGGRRSPLGALVASLRLLADILDEPFVRECTAAGQQLQSTRLLDHLVAALRPTPGPRRTPLRLQAAAMALLSAACASRCEATQLIIASSGAFAAVAALLVSQPPHQSLLTACARRLFCDVRLSYADSQLARQAKAPAPDCSPATAAAGASGAVMGEASGDVLIDAALAALDNEASGRPEDCRQGAMVRCIAAMLHEARAAPSTVARRADPVCPPGSSPRTPIAAAATAEAPEGSDDSALPTKRLRHELIAPIPCALATATSTSAASPPPPQ